MKKPIITTEKMSIIARLKVAWWCITGQRFCIETIQKVETVRFKTHTFIIE